MDELTIVRVREKVEKLTPENFRTIRASRIKLGADDVFAREILHQPHQGFHPQLHQPLHHGKPKSPIKTTLLKWLKWLKWLKRLKRLKLLNRLFRTKRPSLKRLN